jgi:hypothetical protein
MLGTFLLVNDAQCAGIPDEQMPVVKDAKHVCVNMGEVEEIVQIVAPQGLQDTKELVGEIGCLVWGCTVEFLQRSGAGADEESATGAQVLGQRPSLRPREDLSSRKEQALENEREKCHGDISVYFSLRAHRKISLTPASLVSKHISKVSLHLFYASLIWR